MLIEQTVQKMKTMKMSKMAQSLKDRLGRLDHQGLSVVEFVGILVEDEFQHRQDLMRRSRLRHAKFKEVAACVENIDFKMKRDLSKKMILNLAEGNWIRQHQNLVFTGPSGIGKSYLAQAFGHQAIRDGFSVLYMRCPKLYQQLALARAKGSYLNKLRSFAKVNVIILDDFGVTTMDETNRQDLFELIEDRHGSQSTVVASQLPIEQWRRYLGGGVIANSLCDRLLRNAHHVKLAGPSGRHSLD